MSITTPGLQRNYTLNVEQGRKKAAIMWTFVVTCIVPSLVPHPFSVFLFSCLLHPHFESFFALLLSGPLQPPQPPRWDSQAVPTISAVSYRTIAEVLYVTSVSWISKFINLSASLVWFAKDTYFSTWQMLRSAIIASRQSLLHLKVASQPVWQP